MQIKNKSIICDGGNMFTPYNVKKSGHYIDSGGAEVEFYPYYIASMPVHKNYKYKMINSSSNGATYCYFADASGQRVGDLIQNVHNQKGWSSFVNVPAGASLLVVTMEITDGAPILATDVE
jgi:hypothetical protein